MRTPTDACGHLIIKMLQQQRHTGMDSHQAILPDALQVNANLFQTDLCRNPGAMDGFELTIQGTGYPLPGGYDRLVHDLTE